MFYKAAISLLLLYSIIRGTNSVCPNQEFIEPCSCRTAAFGSHVVCQTINSTDTLTDIFEVLARYEINTLLFNSLRFNHPLPRDTFSGLRVQNLRFADSMFKFSDNAQLFQGLEDHLNSLDISNCYIEGLGESSFNHLRVLTEMNVNFDPIHTISSTWFREGPRSVRFLQLDHNQIQLIANNAFHGLDDLERISLADNRLDQINRDVFPKPGRRLTWLDLSYNKLEELPENMFIGMQALKRVVLTGNRLRTLPEHTWSGVLGRLEHLMLKDNPIICDAEIGWVYQRRRFPSHLDGTCKAPEELNGTRLSVLTADKLNSTNYRRK